MKFSLFALAASVFAAPTFSSPSSAASAAAPSATVSGSTSLTPVVFVDEQGRFVSNYTLSSSTWNQVANTMISSLSRRDDTTSCDVTSAPSNGTSTVDSLKQTLNNKLAFLCHHKHRGCHRHGCTDCDDSSCCKLLCPWKCCGGCGDCSDCCDCCDCCDCGDCCNSCDCCGDCCGDCCCNDCCGDYCCNDCCCDSGCCDSSCCDKGCCCGKLGCFCPSNWGCCC